jgi:hypothetical protein
MDRSFVQTLSYQSPAVSVKDADKISFYPQKHYPQQKVIYDLYIVQNIPNYILIKSICKQNNNKHIKKILFFKKFLIEIYSLPQGFISYERVKEDQVPPASDLM